MAQLPIKRGELDGGKLEFRSNSRPEVRYLYFHYCCQVLRRALGPHHEWRGLPHPHSKGRGEVGGQFWGTPSRYLPRNMLLDLVEELGHEHKDQLQGAGFNQGSPALKDIDWYETEDDNEDASQYGNDAEETEAEQTGLHCRFLRRCVQTIQCVL
ncbi:hypothetical protein BJY00DRAFT_316071 [Aspergillus carlsbadensis]|nr:hypothetical protein BJY00DRAFT_316071 [Aspergillus carlsbadensis]